MSKEVFIKAKLKAQIALYNGIAREYDRLGYDLTSKTYDDMSVGLELALKIMDEEITNLIDGHVLLENLKKITS